MTEAERLAQALEAAISPSQLHPEDDVAMIARWFLEDAAAILRAQAAELEALRAELDRRTTRYLAKTGGELVVELRILVNDESKAPVFEGRWLAENSFRWCAAPPIGFTPGMQFEGFSYNPHITPTPPLVIGTIKNDPR